MTGEQFSKAGFLKTYGLPVLFLVLVPAVGWWFSSHATARYDARMRDMAISSIERDASMPEEAKNEGQAFYEANPVSALCVSDDPRLRTLVGRLESECSDIAQFTWMRRLSVGSLAIGLFAFLFASACVAVSLASQRALYASFVAGWQVLKAAALLQAIGQGIVLVLLSFWLTVFWFERYFPKLILFAGIAAAAAIWLIVKAIFKRIDMTPEVEGISLTPQAAPAFWAHVREMCRRMQTDPPAHIIAGVDDNFFVTENPVSVQGEVLHGRTLFVSFSLLKFMEKAEADSVLAHEMAHFSGEDTHYTKRMSPMLARYGEYLEALHQGVVSRPIFHFMLFFWALFQLSINRMSRQREFRADRLAAEATSPLHMGRALLKVVAYTTYRRRIEHELFSRDARQETIAIAARVSQGFGSYVSSSNLLGDIGAASFPHPFDSHPPLDARLAAVRAPIVPSHYPRLLLQPVESSWLAEIEGAEAIEQQMWSAYENRFAAAHEESLAWRYVPQNDEERAVVEAHFPAVQMRTKKQDATLEMDFTGLRFSEWEGPVVYGDIESCEVRESFGRKFLSLKRGKGTKKVEVPLNRFADSDQLVGHFQRFYARHQNVQQYQASLAEGQARQDG